MKKISSLIARVTLFSFFLLAVAPTLIPVMSSAAFAQTSLIATTSSVNSNVLTDVMCNVLRIVTGSGGKAFAAFAILSVGIGFFTGKVSWGLMIGVAAGIAAMFGASSIVSAITGQDAMDCTTYTR